MPDPDAVKRELSRLAAGEPSVPMLEEDPDSGIDDCGAGAPVGLSGPATPRETIPPSRDERPAIDRETVVDEAAEAVEDLDSAASFRRDGGLPRLRRAVESAGRADDRSVLRRGQRALAAYERFDRAASPGSAEDLPAPTDDAAGLDGEESAPGRRTPEKPHSRNPYRGPGQNEST